MKTRPKSRKLLNTTAALLCAAPPTMADTNISEPAAGVLELDPIYAQLRDEHGNAADRGTTVYVSDAELERARMGDVKDLFSGIANVTVGGAIPVAQKIFVNGVDMLNLSVTVDGISQNNRIFHHASANAFDPGLMKSVRVDPGVAASDNGPFALAGGVAMETVDAEDILKAGAAFGGNSRLSYDSNSNSISGSATIAGRAVGLEYLLYLKRATGDDYTDGSDETMTGTRADMSTLLGKVAYETDLGARFEFSAQQLEDNGLRNDKANFGPNSSSTNPSSDLVPYQTRRRMLAASYDANVDSGLWDPNISLGYSETVVDKPQPYGSEGKTDTVSAKLQNTFHLSGTNTITTGLDFLDRKGHYQDPDPASGGPYSESINNIGLFAQARFEPSSGLSISAGARMDWQTFEGSTGMSGPTQFDDSYSGLSGNVSVSYDISPTLTLRGGYSNIFGGLQIEDNYTYWDDFNYADLATARAENYVIGADWQSSNLSVGGELFLTEIKNARGGGNNFDFESKGLNIYATYGWDTGFARLTASHSEVTRDGAEGESYDFIDLGAPLGTVLALEVQQELANPAFVVGGSIDMALDYDTGVSTSYSQVMEGYQVVNLYAEYIPTDMPNVTLRAELKNLFDTEYADRGTYGNDYDYTGFQTLKEPGRSFVFTAVTRF